jgi:anti-sigma-K factor RskA
MSDDRTPDVLAGEFALGVVEGDERAEALRLMASDPGFADAVDRWQVRLGPLYYGILPIDPPTRVWTGVARALPANDIGSPATLRAWRGAAIGFGLLAASLGGVLLVQPVPSPSPPVTIVTAPGPTLVAQLADANGLPLLVASYDRETALLRVRTQAVAGSGEPELWVIGADATPRSLGLLPRNAAGNRTPNPALRSLLVAGSTLALTLEPRDGAPHAAPSTTPIATAKLALL